MATPSSGAISLDQINVEAGGSSGSTISINDVQIRFLDSKSANATSSFNDFYGIEAGGGIMSVGGSVVQTSSTSNYQTTFTTNVRRGFSSYSGDPIIGSLTNDTISNFLSGQEIVAFRNFARKQTGATVSSTGPTLQLYVFYGTGTAAPNTNASFTTMLINETSFNRSAATYNVNVFVSQAQWSWSAGSTIITSTSTADPPFPPVTDPETTVPYVFI